jgi:hypothetical protein
MRRDTVPDFPGLHHFPQGRSFKQWTGDHSRALMKVYYAPPHLYLLLTRLQIIIPALVGRVDDAIVRCYVHLLDFAYLARRNSHHTTTLIAMDRALQQFHAEREFFARAGVRNDENFSLPRQHALIHYVYGIRNFGSPNGLDSSITESKHIDAVKKPWRRSNRHKALSQILTTNTRMYKLAAARIEFGRKGMLGCNLMDDAEHMAAAREAGVEDDDLNDNVYRMEVDPPALEDAEAEERNRDGLDVNAVDVPWSAQSQVYLARQHSTCLCKCLVALVESDDHQLPASVLESLRRRRTYRPSRS